MIWIWLIMGFIGVVIMLLSGKESMKDKLKHFNYLFGIIAIVGGILTLAFGLFMCWFLRNEDKIPYGEPLERGKDE